MWKYFIPGCVGRCLALDLRAPLAAAGNLGILIFFEFHPFGTGLENPGFRTAWDITGQKFQGLGLKLKAFRLTVRDLHRHLCNKNIRVVGAPYFKCLSLFLDLRIKGAFQ